MTDASPLGAAILAATAIGLTTSSTEAAAALIGPVETIEPDAATTAIYDRGYAALSHIVRRADPALRRLILRN